LPANFSSLKARVVCGAGFLLERIELNGLCGYSALAVYSVLYR
jgi:hypothetical protein